jgi:hypothetical protein
MDILPEGLFFVLAVLIRINLERTDREAYEFVGLYVLFFLWMTLEPVGVTETVRGTRLAAESGPTPSARLLLGFPKIRKRFTCLGEPKSYGSIET